MAKTMTKETILENIAKCNAVIAKQQTKIQKLEKQLNEINRQEVINAILTSGKDLSEILDFINS